MSTAFGSTRRTSFTTKAAHFSPSSRRACAEVGAERRVILIAEDERNRPQLAEPVRGGRRPRRRVGRRLPSSDALALAGDHDGYSRTSAAALDDVGRDDPPGAGSTRVSPRRDRGRAAPIRACARGSSSSACRTTIRSATVPSGSAAPRQSAWTLSARPRRCCCCPADAAAVHGAGMGRPTPFLIFHRSRARAWTLVTEGRRQGLRRPGFTDPMTRGKTPCTCIVVPSG